MNDIRIEPLGEDALLLRLGRRVDPALNARVHALAARIAGERPPWLRDIVPAYASLAVGFDPEAFASEGELERAIDWLRGLAGRAAPSTAADDARPPSRSRSATPRGWPPTSRTWPRMPGCRSRRRSPCTAPATTASR